MSDLTFVLMVFYVFVLVVGVALATTSYNEAVLEHGPDERRYWARFLLLMPIWPLAATYLILRHGVPWAMRGLGRLSVDATRELEDS